MDSIKMDLGEIGWGGVDWIGLAQDRNKGLRSKYEVKTPAFWDVMLCSRLTVDQHSRATRCLHFQSQRTSKPSTAVRISNPTKYELYPYLICSCSRIYTNMYFCLLWKEKLVWNNKETFECFTRVTRGSRIPVEELAFAQLLMTFHALYKTQRFIARVVTMKTMLLGRAGGLTSCSLETAWRFRGAYHLHLQGQGVGQGRNQQSLLPMVPLMTQMNPLHILSFFFKVHFYITSPCMPQSSWRLCSLGCPTKTMNSLSLFSMHAALPIHMLLTMVHVIQPPVSSF
jgi:hypothetical protein